MTKRLLALVFALSAWAVQAQFNATLVLFHNMPDNSLDTVDIWLTSPMSIKLVDNISYHKARIYNVSGLPVAAPVTANFAVTSKDASNASSPLGTFSGTLSTNNSRYVVAINGITNTTSGVAVLTGTNTTAGTTRMSLINGAYGTPVIDLKDAATIDDNAMSYGSVSTTYTNVSNTAPLDLRVESDNNANVLARYRWNTGVFGDSAMVLVTGGFWQPETYSLYNEAHWSPYGIWAISPGGRVAALASLSTVPIQIIHNSPDALAPNVDVLINKVVQGTLQYKQATAFGGLELPKTTGNVLKLGLGIAGTGSSMVTMHSEPIDTSSTPTYLVATGVTTLTQGLGTYDKSSNANIDFDIERGTSLVAAPTSGKVAVKLFHGVSDMALIDVRADNVEFNLVTGLEFRTFTSIFTELTPGVYTLRVRLNGNPTLIKSYTADLTNLANNRVLICLTGFRTPANNGGSANGLGMTMYQTNGTHTVLPESTEPEPTALQAATGTLPATLYPNPAAADAALAFTLPQAATVHLRVTDMAGRTVVSGTHSLQAGTHSLPLQVQHLATGMYTVVATTGTHSTTQRLMLQR